MLKNDKKALANLNSLICQIGLLQNYVAALFISLVLHAITMLFIMDPWASFYIINFATQTLFL
jgi:type III secretory pathway component EscS